MIQRYGTECHVDSHREQRLSEIIDSWLRNKDWLSLFFRCLDTVCVE